MPIFHALTINHTVYAEKATVWIKPFDPKLDKLSMIGNDYGFNIVGGNTNDGTLTIINPGGPELTKDDWERVINLPSYRLDVDGLRPHSCPLFTNGKYERTFYVQITDRYGRLSNIVTRKLYVRTASIMYSNRKPVKVSNLSPLISVEISRSTFEPVRNGLNITSGEA